MKNKLILLNNTPEQKITHFEKMLRGAGIQNFIIYNCEVSLKNKKTIEKFIADINSIIETEKISKIFLLDIKIKSFLNKIKTCQIWNKKTKLNENKHVGDLSDIPIYMLRPLDSLYTHPAFKEKFLSFFEEKKEVVVRDYKELKYNQPVCVDIETTGLNHRTDKILVAGIGTKEGVKSSNWSPRVLALLKDICKQTSCFVAHRADFDLSFLMKEGCPLPRKVFDTLVASKFYKTNLHSYNMENLCFDLLDLKYHTEYIDKEKLENDDINRVLEFNVKDVQKEIELARFLGKKVIKENPKVSTIFNYYMDAVRMFTLVRNQPVLLNENLIQKEKAQLENEINALSTSIKSTINIENLNSSKQLGEVLFNQYKLPIINYTETGLPSTDSKSLQEINYHKPIKVLTDIILYRQKQSIMSKFYNKYQSEIYSVYNVYGAETGRTSCSSSNHENLQQTPPDMLFRWLLNGQSKFDFSQIELKVGAYVSGEVELLKLFQQGKDVHDYTRRKIQRLLTDAGVPEEYQRRVAKTLNFGAFYGGGGSALHNTLMKEGIYLPLQECYKFANALRRVFPNQDKYRFEVELELMKKGYVDILPARKADYYIHGLDVDDYKRTKIIREAANAKIQGFASGDISLCAVVDLWLKHGLVPLIYRHDEAVYKEPHKELIKCKEDLENSNLLLSYGIDLNIPLTVDFTDLTEKKVSG